MILQKKRLFILLGTAAILLCIPAIAMLFTDEVKWSGLDFTVAGILLFGTAWLLDWVISRVTEKRIRILLVVGLLLMLLLIWLELAVGILGTGLAGS